MAQDNSSSVRTIAIVGLPNSGKSRIFNILTGDYALVANYPFTTVEMKSARCEIGGQSYEVVDTPGLHCLYIHSEEELVVRDMILTRKPDIIIQCIDANRLKPSFTLTADLLELGIPMVIALNALDETMRRGVWIDSGGLSRLLGIPVVELMALHGRGTGELRNAIGRARSGRGGVQYGEIIEDGVSTIGRALPDDLCSKRKIAILALLQDPFLYEHLARTPDVQIATLKELATEIRQRFRGNVSRVMNTKRGVWIDDLCEKIVRKQKIAPGQTSQMLAHLSRHPVFGIPILSAVIIGMCLLVVNVGNVLAAWMDTNLWGPVERGIIELVPAGFLSDFLIGDYGVLSMGLANALLTILPILSVFFLGLNILEDVGYLPNLCVLTKRVLAKIGLSGGAIVPLTLGFGCKTMATLTTTSLRSTRERYIAVFLIAFALPCGAQTAINIGILGRLGLSAFVISFGVLALVEIVAGIVLSKIMKEEQKSDFIQELPAMRLPNAKAVLVKTYYRLWWFIKEATPIFVGTAIFLFTIDRIGLLDATRTMLIPVVRDWLGLPLKMVDVLIVCMARREVAAGLVLDLVDKGLLDYKQCIVAVTITSMFAPCLANVAAIVKKLGWKTALGMVVAINISAVAIAGVLNWALTACGR